MGPLGVPETIFIFVLALLIFGPKKLPELGRTLGKAMTEFRRASNELKATFDREMSSIERENESLKEVTRQYTPEYNYDSYYDSGAYGSESHDSTASTTPPVSASAPQGADTAASLAHGNGHHEATAMPDHPKPAELHAPAPATTPVPDPRAVKAD